MFVQLLLQWKTIIITYCEFVFVALVIQHAMRMRRIVVCGCLALHFAHIIPQTARFSKTKVIEHKMCVFSFSTKFI
jgi:hypothetical protein